MHHKIYPAARRRIIEIWHYTDKTWGVKQADNYVHGLHQAIEKAAINKSLWRKVRGLFCGGYLRGVGPR